ncbi:hypothetical protein HXS80_16175 [Streptomyces sp. CB04723]|uniref:UPF0158 family protein n=1 Tax=Streptomyces TaxID=1883 RepID=UPI0015C445E6|nr:UPF0158 family protein [Streptomyces sp. CB04723]QLG33058.1 hypothetical protein HXS80_16175 [Streptomyces sp. CB04723]
MTNRSVAEGQPLPDEQSAGEGNDEAFAVLAEAVTSLMQPGNRPPTGSEIRLDMKRRTYGGFNPKALGYKRFRDFLDDAEAQGFVVIDRDRPGDVAVTIPGVRQASSQSSVIRRDLWKAFIDWNPAFVRYFAFDQNRAIMIPKVAAPLEPSRYATIRGHIKDEPENFCEIKPVSYNVQHQWMQEFTANVSEEKTRTLLEKSLESEKPAKMFAAVLRTLPGVQQAWYGKLRDGVDVYVQEWLASDARLADVEIYAPRTIESESAPGKHANHSVSESEKGLIEAASVLASNSMGISKNLAQFLLSSSGEKERGSSDLRSSLHAAIDRMPDEELRKIVIPVGYLFEA